MLNSPAMTMGEKGTSRRRAFLINILTLCGSILVMIITAVLILVKQAFLDREFLNALSEKLQNSIYSRLAGYNASYVD